MATGRTVLKWSKVYVDGYDLSGVTRTFGPLTVTMEEADGTALGDAIKGALPNQPMINVGTINCVFDNTAGASHPVLDSQASRTVMLPLGMRAAPVAGDDVFCGSFSQKEFLLAPSDSGSVVTLSASFTGWAADAATVLYGLPWGSLVHAKAAETAVNSASGIDDRGAQTTKGGYLCYQFFSSNGTATLKVQDSADNSSFADLVSAGSLDASSAPKHGLVVLANTATVRRYLRWQIVFGTATTATFALAFVRI